MYQVPKSRFCAVLLLALMLVGCQRYVAYYKKDLDPSIQFDKSDEGAIVVVGTLLSHPAEGAGLLGTKESWFAKWELISNELETISSNYASAISAVRRGGCESGRQSVTPCVIDHQQPQYLVFRVIPGEYMFWRITQSGETSWTVLPWVAPKGDEGRRITDAAKRKNTVPWFRVNAGEVAYIGDYVFDIKGRQSKLVDIENNSKAANAAIEGYRGIKEKLVFRPLSGGLDYANLKMIK